MRCAALRSRAGSRPAGCWDAWRLGLCCYNFIANRAAALVAPTMQDQASGAPAAQAASTSAPRAKSKAEQLMERELATKRVREERAAANGGGAGVNGGGGGGRKDAPWLQPGIIVKVRGAAARRTRRVPACAPGPAGGAGELSTGSGQTPERRVCLRPVPTHAPTPCLAELGAQSCTRVHAHVSVVRGHAQGNALFTAPLGRRAVSEACTAWRRRGVRAAHALLCSVRTHGRAAVRRPARRALE